MQSQLFDDPASTTANGSSPGSTPCGPWAPLRTDLQIHRSNEQGDQRHGNSAHHRFHTWLLFDPLRGQYLELGELEVLVLQLWHLGSTEKVAAEIAAQQGCEIDPRQIESVVRFVKDNELLQTSSDALSAKLASVSRAQQRLVKLQKSLFWRRPLFVPELSCRLLLPLARATAAGGFYALLVCTALFCAVSVGQHWSEFIAYFDAGWNPVGAVIFFFCYLLLSLVHELGHASVARLYGIRANSIGVGLIALMPIMFSEITDAWRLPRKARLHISAAGVTFECALGVAAAMAWCLLDDGPLRALMFYLFTASLLTTLMINANPLMKFDGYYLLSDYTGEKNLQQIANTSLRHWIWSRLLRHYPAPTGRRQRLLILFGLASLVYRLMVFAFISYAAYQLLFKAAGILVFLLCIGLLLCVPAFREISGFLGYLKEQNSRRDGDQPASQSGEDPMQSSQGKTPLIPGLYRWLRLFRPGALLTIITLLALLLIPLPWPVQIPAATYFSAEQKAMAPAGATLRRFVRRGEAVTEGQIIAEFHNDELAYRIARTRTELNLLQRRQHSDGFAETLDALDGIYLQDLLSKRQLLRALETEQRQLQVSAQVSGVVDWVLPGLGTDQFLDLNQPFLTIADRRSLAGRAYAQAQQTMRLNVADTAERKGRLFLSGQWQPVPVTVIAVEQIASRRIQDPALASVNGGPLQSLADDPRRSAEALHLILFDVPQTSRDDARSGPSVPISAQRTGHLVLLGEPVSLLQLLTQRVAGVLIRESGV
ncbi:M50 family metallopeptidase [Microbulbifer sp. HZ11]|uniref:M50 family metallopeptidase n=1 Tax=Microbulbifer sp. HZ11 TaxID=1453501 RepID=UPI0005BCB4F6|nr:M50 family metallopeptidase [Microbulbifer sp. HZ11]